MLKFLKFRFLLIYLSLGYKALWAVPSFQTQELLRLNKRPTMVEIRHQVAGLEFDTGVPLALGFGDQYLDKRLDIKKWTDVLIHKCAEILPIFENTYPNATWIFLGRDAAAVADVFEAFYFSLGMPDRVRRVGVSKASFSDMTDKKLQGLLKQVGVDLGEVSVRKPLIFVDSISSGGGRQSRRILAKIYAWRLLKVEARKIPRLSRQFNILGMRVSTTGAAQTIPPQNVKQAQVQLSTYLNAATQLQTIPSIESYLFNLIPVVAIEEAPHHANEAGYSHFIGAWHDSYGPFGDNDQPELGQPFHTLLRQSVLWTQKKIWQEINDGNFSQLVRQNALKNGLRYEDLFGQNNCVEGFEK